ncbi:DUF1015 domain-containing protein [Candidatus Aminicenantes bacterium AC-708-M15]|jgi:uncharacterized protein (DUF1015 family)|nr:DUF1015 domain-containing protein [SCandidatus Aminicenantes bacterium Aminicenantia_JdfR_composite]MCP2597437.1 DUF1015 domain-containing protein [Candidatus Aminicenantes bacterium AC-335-G13]MCP2598621.1 DUF1015 domain-containing protein [Candidatus Aminicenantes bacterium AC-335-L06]MCP2604379.1 DUF1015 domain-containing protein [Candidatus Aminicenantes bacterium AC-708-M15]MCP2618744.1 DUF1015 domain-containing protein [Candidatus Aminicenantes bacterium AC-335-A11]
MAELQPFRGIRYNSKKLPLEKLITEPYDRITPEMQEEYYQRHPYNIVRIILGKDVEPNHPEKDKYKRAKLYLDEWLKKGIFIREDKDSFYIYEQEFKIDGEIKKRKGLIARVKLEDFSSKKVLPHEKTFPKPKEDRLNLLRATNSNTEQIFLLYEDPDFLVNKKIDEALHSSLQACDVKDEDGIIHRLWVIKDEKIIQDIQRLMADKILIIADGHHRYETSLNYRDEMIKKLGKVKGDEPFNYIMMTLFNLDDPGLVILPTYRLVKGLEKLSEADFKNLLAPYFEIEEKLWSNLNDKSIIEEVKNILSGENHIFAVYISEFKKFFILRLKSGDILDKEINSGKSKEWKRLDVSILHSLIIDKFSALTDREFSVEKNVSYIRNLYAGIEKVNRKEYQMICLLNPVSLHQIRDIVKNGELMPHKSTDFYPKLKSGLIINPLF